MSGRVGKSLAFICAMATFIAAMGSSCVVAHAEDSTDDNTLVAEPDQPVYEESEGDSGDKIIGDLLEDSLGYDVCFFIRNEVDADIPNEPASHPSLDYSEAIRIDNAARSDQFVYHPDFDETADSFESDGFTAYSEVMDQLSVYPTLEEIKSVFSNFDSKSQYVFWYVIKRAATGEPNSDVYIHVDGVVRTRQNPVTEPDPSIVPDPGTDPEPPAPDEPAPEVPVPDISGLTFNVYPKELERITVDDEEYIGGFVIEVHDAGGQLLAEYAYGIHGQLIYSDTFTEASPTDSDVDSSFGDELGIEWGKGTDFTFMGYTFHINVDTAYIRKRADEFQVIPMLFGREEVKPGDVSISDNKGHVLANAASVPKVTVKHKITVTAGTSVQNDNGQTLTNTKAIISDGSLMKGHRLEATFNGSQTGPGESTNEITDLHIYDSNGREATAYYDVELKKGRLVLVANDTSESSDDNGNSSVVTRILVKDDKNTAPGNDQKAQASGSVRSGSAQDSKKRLSAGDGEVRSGRLEADTDTGEVLGARRADTSDSAMNPGTRLALIVLCIMLISIINIKRNKTE